MERKEHIQSRSDIKILVVDDREDNLLSIETILDRDGYRIMKAGSGREALKILLREQDFTLILMDVQMPDMNGFETASLIYEREKLKHIPIIFITAHNQDETNMFQGYKMGAVDFIYKPVNPELLRFKVSVFVELYHKTHQLMLQEKHLLAANTNLEKEIEERRISEEKIRLLNKQLLRSNAELKAINEELDRFVYVASHDLQEPLRKISFFGDRIAEKYKDKIDADLSSDLQKIISASRRMNLLINDLLKFSRNSIQRNDFTHINLKELVQEVLADIEVEIERLNAVVEVVDLPRVWGVPSQLHQLFQNLISNALKFSRKEVQPVIKIYADTAEAHELFEDGRRAEGRYYRIYVQDNGIGFDPKYAQEIFVVFKRLHNAHDFEGTGVGLSICKKIVESHNGFIKAESKVNEGSTFIICLPEKVENFAPLV